MEIKKEEKRIDKNKIIILLPFWSHERVKEKIGEYTFDSIKAYIPNDFGYVHYFFSVDLINPNPILTRKYFNQLISDIYKDIKKIQNKQNKKEFYIFAQSLGGLFAMIISDKIEIKKVSLICPGYNLTDCFWNSTATREIRTKMQKSGVKKEELKKMWLKISPDYYFKNKSKNTKFYIELSKNDNVIPYKNGRSLVKFLKEKKINFEVSEIGLSHELALMEEGPFF